MAKKDQPKETQTEAKQQGPEFAIQRIYVKDLSLEAPNTPGIFRVDEWKPNVNVDLNVKTDVLEEHLHEVILIITITAKIKEQAAFVIEINQAGVFTLRNFADDQVQHMLHTFCPNILFPYAREVASDLMNRGGFPPLYLAPINFEALYKQQQEKAAAGGDK